MCSAQFVNMCNLYVFCTICEYVQSQVCFMQLWNPKKRVSISRLPTEATQCQNWVRCVLVSCSIKCTYASVQSSLANNVHFLSNLSVRGPSSGSIILDNSTESTGLLFVLLSRIVLPEEGPWDRNVAQEMNVVCQ